MKGVKILVQDGDNKNRLQILFHAKILYAEKGFAGTSMRDIAQAASVNLSLIYYYFKNKEDLFFSVLEEGFLGLDQALRKDLSNSQNIVESIRRFIREFLIYIFDNKYHFSIIQQEITMHNGRYFRSIIAKHRENSWNKFEDLIKRGVEEGTLQQTDYRLTYFSLMGMMVYYAMAKPIIQDKLGKEDYDSDFLESLIQHITDLFLHGAIKK